MQKHPHLVLLYLEIPMYFEPIDGYVTALIQLIHFFDQMYHARLVEILKGELKDANEGKIIHVYDWSE